VIKDRSTAISSSKERKKERKIIGAVICVNPSRPMEKNAKSSRKKGELTFRVDEQNPRALKGVVSTSTQRNAQKKAFLGEKETVFLSF